MSARMTVDEFIDEYANRGPGRAAPALSELEALKNKLFGIMKRDKLV